MVALAQRIPVDCSIQRDCLFAVGVLLRHAASLVAVAVTIIGWAVVVLIFGRR